MDRHYVSKGRNASKRSIPPGSALSTTKDYIPSAKLMAPDCHPAGCSYMTTCFKGCIYMATLPTQHVPNQFISFQCGSWCASPSGEQSHIHKSHGLWESLASISTHSVELSCGNPGEGVGCIPGRWLQWGSVKFLDDLIACWLVNGKYENYEVAQGDTG